MLKYEGLDPVIRLKAYLFATYTGNKAYGTFRKVQNVGECFPVATPTKSTIIELIIALTQ